MTITCSDLTITYADRPVLDGISCTVAPGQRVGLVGENGSGKSSLLNALAGRLPPASGTVQLPSDYGFVAQDTGIARTATVSEVLRDALAPLHAAVARLEQLAARITDPAAAGEYDRLLEWATAHDAWDATRRAEVAAQRLGLATIPGDRSAGALSGGQLARLALAALLIRRPTAVLLDEPTNHLDDEALDFLESQLISMTGAVLVASHDRVFLDRVCTRIIDLDPSHFGTDGRGGRLFTGDYTAYLGAKAQARRRWAEAFEAQQDELNDLRVAANTTNLDISHNRPPRDGDKFIYGFKGSRVQAAVSRRRRNADQRIDTILRDQIPKPPAPMRFSGSFSRQPTAYVSVRDVVVPGRVTCSRLDVGPGEHLLITGPNGCGKSTLLAVLGGRLAPPRGQVSRRAREVGLLTQEVGIPDLSVTAEALYAAADPREPLRSLGLLHPRDAGRPVGELSLGQQRRVELALLLARQPDLLLLDEPTNHLSLALVDELEQALATSPVTVVVASHDRWLRRRWPAETVDLRSRSAVPGVQDCPGGPSRRAIRPRGRQRDRGDTPPAAIAIETPGDEKADGIHR